MTPDPTRTIRVRKMDFPFAEAAIPRWWLHGNPTLTHLANGLNLLFPAGERFFIRSVKHYLDPERSEVTARRPLLSAVSTLLHGRGRRAVAQRSDRYKGIDDPELRSRVKAFFGQEGRHGHEHERMNAILEAQGYDLSRFLHLYEKVGFGVLEPLFPPILRLSTTVALEHFTASLAESALTTPFLDGAHPVMAQLLRWHAAEEIEHKSVAFDVLAAVDPRYSVRVAGLAVGLSQLLAWWLVASVMLAAQEDLSREERAAWRAKAKRARVEHGASDRVGLFKRAVLEYLRPSFHPDDRDDYHLAQTYLASVGAG